MEVQQLGVPERDMSINMNYSAYKAGLRASSPARKKEGDSQKSDRSNRSRAGSRLGSPSGRRGSQTRGDSPSLEPRAKLRSDEDAVEDDSVSATPSETGAQYEMGRVVAGQCKHEKCLFDPEEFDEYKDELQNQFEELENKFEDYLKYDEEDGKNYILEVMEDTMQQVQKEIEEMVAEKVQMVTAMLDDANEKQKENILKLDKYLQEKMQNQDDNIDLLSA